MPNKNEQTDDLIICPSGKIGLLFSGGLDSTLEAVERLKKYETIFLLTFNNGYCININSSVERAKELQRHYGQERIVHSVVDTKPLFQDLLAEYGKHQDAYRSPLIYDLVCKMAAVVELIFYAKSHGVKEVSDGSSSEQNQIFIQQPGFSEHISQGIGEYQIDLIHPVLFHLSRKEKIDILRKSGFRSGSSSLEKIFVTSQVLHQPFCMRAFVTFFFTGPFRHLSVVRKRGLPLEKANELWDLLWPAAKRHLDTKLDKQ